MNNPSQDDSLIPREHVFGRCKVATWAYINAEGQIRFQGRITLGQDQYCLVQVMGEMLREKAETALLEGLNRLLKDTGEVVEYLSGKMPHDIIQLHRAR